MHSENELSVTKSAKDPRNPQGQPLKHRLRSGKGSLEVMKPGLRHPDLKSPDLFSKEKNSWQNFL